MVLHRLFRDSLIKYHKNFRAFNFSKLYSSDIFRGIALKELLFDSEKIKQRFQ